MIQSPLAVCAESVVRDADTNLISIFNVFEELTVPAFPVALAKLSVLFILERDSSDPDQVECIAVLLNGEREINRVQITADFEDKPRTRVIIVAQGLVIENPGTLILQLIYNDHVVNNWRILVQQGDS